ncbi:MAG TPA: response regulator [Dehalococcoidia bacterium]|nr:response regulator [Dehalococcoidia bacterium]
MQDGPKLKKTVLVVDDDAMLVSSIWQALMNEGYNVVAARNSELAVSLTREKKPDLILLEITVSGFDGRQTIKKIREISRVPIFVITNERNELILQNTLNCGADDLIRKPVKINMLVNRIQARLARNSVKSESDMLGGSY